MDFGIIPVVMDIGYAQVNMDNGIVSLGSSLKERHNSDNGLTRVDDENVSSRGLNKNLGRRGRQVLVLEQLLMGKNLLRDATELVLVVKYYNVTKPGNNFFRKILLINIRAQLR